MIELFLLGVLAVAAVAVVAVVSVVFLLLKLVLWTVLLPIRLLFKLLWIPIGLAAGAAGLALGAVAIPFLLLAAGGILLFGLLAALAALLLPLIPFVLFGLLLWAVFRGQPATA